MKKMEEKKSLSLFTAETLDSLAMAELMGGDTNTYCNGGNCVTQCGCGSKTGTGACNEVPVNGGAGSCTKVNCKPNSAELCLVGPPPLSISNDPFTLIDLVHP